MNSLVVSFTSYPARINNIGKVLESICAQTIHPDRTVLYLAESQFPEKKVIIDIDRYKDCGFEIRWCPKDLGAHKKYFYAMQEFPGSCIVTIDDDVFYSNTMIEELWKHHERHPHAVIARYGSKIVFKDKKTVSAYSEWYGFIQQSVPSMDNLAKGAGGILYPPQELSKELFNDKTFMSLAPFTDDLWLKLVQLLSDIPVAFAASFFADETLDGNDNGLFVNYNRDGGNDNSFKALLDHYGRSALITSIQKDGFLLESDLPLRKLSDARKIFFDVKEVFLHWLDFTVGNSRFYIFGAGKVARNFHAALTRLNLGDRIICSLVSCVTENVNSGFEMRSFKDIYIGDREKIIICVGCKLSSEIEKKLVSRGVPEEDVIRIPQRIIYAMYILNLVDNGL